MTPQEWKEFHPYFTAKECGEGMSQQFMRKVLLFRLDINASMIVHEGFSKDGHAPDSYHYRGEALDFHVPGVSMRETLRLLDKHGFGGAGVYYWWNNPGFHIDTRPLDRYQRWYSPRAGEYIYLISPT
ncbi:MAG: hypothetical protein BWZ01_02919 [Deltaproteobacteria bacterium ADurb.BinA179]|nr:MAG: hypothetical protein BWZ01_02919 [Deltaproteobacteria bacterium ADurb.BinA179]